MAELKGANVTKFDAGGSGDNYVDSGLIKAVERIWTDTYVFASALNSLATIVIAKVPKNAKITGIDLFFPALSTGAVATGSTISIGYRASTATTTGGTTFLSAGEAAAGVRTLSANQGLFTVMSAASDIYLAIGRIVTTTTAGTISSIVRYTM